MECVTTPINSLDEVIIRRISQRSHHRPQVILSLSEEVYFLNMGISGATLKSVAGIIPRSIVLQAVGTDTTNLSKLYRRKHLATWQSDSINHLSITWLEITDFFEQNNEDINEWLSTSLPALEGATPESLMGTMTGRQAISACLNTMRYGDF